MKTYEQPTIGLISYSLQDVITASTDPGRKDITWND